MRSITSTPYRHLNERLGGGAETHTGQDVLAAFSQGRMSKEKAVAALGLRDYAELLVMLGDAGMPLPTLPADEIEAQATLFARLWRPY